MTRKSVYAVAVAVFLAGRTPISFSPLTTNLSYAVIQYDEASNELNSNGDDLHIHIPTHLDNLQRIDG